MTHAVAVADGARLELGGVGSRAYAARSSRTRCAARRRAAARASAPSARACRRGRGSPSCRSRARRCRTRAGRSARCRGSRASGRASPGRSPDRRAPAARCAAHSPRSLRCPLTGSSARWSASMSSSGQSDSSGQISSRTSRAHPVEVLLELGLGREVPGHRSALLSVVESEGVHPEAGEGVEQCVVVMSKPCTKTRFVMRLVIAFERVSGGERVERRVGDALGSASARSRAALRSANSRERSSRIAREVGVDLARPGRAARAAGRCARRARGRRGWSPRSTRRGRQGGASSRPG